MGAIAFPVCCGWFEGTESNLLRTGSDTDRMMLKAT